MMTRIPTLDDLREIVDSPHLSDDVKSQVAQDYFDYVEELDEEELYQLGFDSEDHMNNTHDWYSENYDFGDVGQAFSDEDDIFGEYEEAKKQHDAGVVSTQKKQESDAEAKRYEAAEQLDDFRKKRSETDPGVANSNDILDKGVEGAVRGLERFCPAYNRAVGVLGSDAGTVNYERDVLQRYDEQRNIPFDVFAEEADKIGKLREDLVESLSSQSNRLATVFSHWQGGAADSAQGRWRQIEKLSNSEVKESLSESSEAILRACSAVAASCQRKADWSLKFAIPNWCGLQPYEIDMAVKIANSGRDATDAEITHFIRHLPSEDQETIDDDKGDLEDETKDAAERMAREWLLDFTRSFAKFVSDFHVMCDNEKNATDEAWGNLTQFLNGLPEDPYAAMAAGSPAPPAAPAAAGGPSGSVGGGPSVGGGGAAGLGGGPSGALGGAPSGGGGGPSAMASPATPSMPKPDMGQDAVNPVTGNPLDVDPKTGSPYPIDPATGDVVKDAAPDVDTVTVRQGENEIAITEPNRDGEMSVRIDDGSGKAAEYKLDFGSGGTSGGEQAASGFGPTGGANGVPGGAAAMAGSGAPSAVDVHTPSEDGTIQIHDGELSIVAEQPLGPDGATVVTVDTGSGEPETYVMGDEDAVREYNDRTTGEFGAPPQAEPGTPPQAEPTAPPQAGGEAAPRAESGIPPHVGGDTPSQVSVDAVSGDRPENGRFEPEPQRGGIDTGPQRGGFDADPQESGVVQPAAVSAEDGGAAGVADAFTEPSEPSGARGSLDGVGAGISGSAGGEQPRGVGGSLGAELGGGSNAGGAAGPGAGSAGAFGEPAGGVGGAFGESGGGAPGAVGNPPEPGPPGPGGPAGLAGGAAGFADGGGPHDEGAQGGGLQGESPAGESPRDEGLRSGAVSTDGSAGIGSVPGEPASAPTEQSGGAGVSGAGGGAPMMGGGGAGAGGGGEDQQRSAAYPLHETGLFEPDVAEGPFGIARISGSLDDDEPAL